MPSVMEAPELVEDVETHELTTHGLTIERPQPRQARPGFWRTLAHTITTHLRPTPRKRHAPSCSVPRPFETPADMLARQYPNLYIRAYCGV
jgi:hypothetical protein